MGDSESGGDGSVHWKLEAKNADEADHKHIGKKVDQRGKDDDGDEGTDFTVSIRRPGNLSQQQFLDHLRSASGLKLSTKDGDRVYFNHPIEHKKAQIRVSWGDSNHHEGTGGLPTGSTTQA